MTSISSLNRSEGKLLFEGLTCEIDTNFENCFQLKEDSEAYIQILQIHFSRLLSGVKIITILIDIIVA